MSYMTIASGTFVNIPPGVLNRGDAGKLAIERFELQEASVAVGQWRAFLGEYAGQRFAQVSMPGIYMKMTQWEHFEDLTEALRDIPLINGDYNFSFVNRTIPTAMN